MLNHMHDLIENQLLKERDQIAENIQKNQSISSQELEKLDKIYHALKSMATYCAMKEADEYQNRSHTSMVRDTNRESYEEGYNRGYSEAMNRMPINSYHELRRY